MQGTRAENRETLTSRGLGAQWLIMLARLLPPHIRAKRGVQALVMEWEGP